MKRITKIIFALLILPVTFTAQMQEPMHGDSTGSMKGGMMMDSEMMQVMMPMMQNMRLINMIPMMNSQLDLTDEQVDKMIEIQKEFKKKQIDMKAEMMKMMHTLNNKMENNSEVSDIQNSFQELSQYMVKMMTSAYSASKEMKSVLSEKQLERLKNMSGHMRDGHMMNHDMMREKD